MSNPLESVPEHYIFGEIKKILKREVKASSKVISDYVCKQVAETISPIWTMLGEINKAVEDHERRIKELEKRINDKPDT